MKEKRLFMDLEMRINERMGKLEFSEKQVFWFSQDVKLWLPKKVQ